MHNKEALCLRLIGPDSDRLDWGLSRSWRSPALCRNDHGRSHASPFPTDPCRTATTCRPPLRDQRRSRGMRPSRRRIAYTAVPWPVLLAGAQRNTRRQPKPPRCALAVGQRAAYMPLPLPRRRITLVYEAAPWCRHRRVPVRRTRSPSGRRVASATPRPRGGGVLVRRRQRPSRHFARVLGRPHSLPRWRSPVRTAGGTPLRHGACPPRRGGSGRRCRPSSVSTLPSRRPAAAR